MSSALPSFYPIINSVIINLLLLCLQRVSSHSWFAAITTNYQSPRLNSSNVSPLENDTVYNLCILLPVNALLTYSGSRIGVPTGNGLYATVCDALEHLCHPEYCFDNVRDARLRQQSTNTILTLNWRHRSAFVNRGDSSIISWLKIYTRYK